MHIKHIYVTHRTWHIYARQTRICYTAPRYMCMHIIHTYMIHHIYIMDIHIYVALLHQGLSLHIMHTYITKVNTSMHMIHRYNTYMYVSHQGMCVCLCVCVCIPCALCTLHIYGSRTKVRALICVGI